MQSVSEWRITIESMTQISTCPLLPQGDLCHVMLKKTCTIFVVSDLKTCSWGARWFYFPKSVLLCMVILPLIGPFIQNMWDWVKKKKVEEAKFQKNFLTANWNAVLATEIFLPSLIMATQSETSGMGRHDGWSLEMGGLGSWFVDLGSFSSFRRQVT